MILHVKPPSRGRNDAPAPAKERSGMTQKTPQWEKALGLIWNRWAGPSDFTDAGIMQYNARLFDLKEMGWKIKSEWVRSLEAKYKRYKMVANDNPIMVAEYYSGKQGRLL